MSVVSCKNSNLKLLAKMDFMMHTDENLGRTPALSMKKPSSKLGLGLREGELCRMDHIDEHEKQTKVSLIDFFTYFRLSV